MANLCKPGSVRQRRTCSRDGSHSSGGSQFSDLLITPCTWLRMQRALPDSRPTPCQHQQRGRCHQALPAGRPQQPARRHLADRQQVRCTAHTGWAGRALRAAGQEQARVQVADAAAHRHGRCRHCPNAAAAAAPAAAAQADFRQRKPEDVRVLVVGPTGYIGRYVVKELIRRGYSVAAFARPKSGIGGKSSQQDVQKVCAAAATGTRVRLRVQADGVHKTMGTTSARAQLCRHLRSWHSRACAGC